MAVRMARTAGAFSLGESPVAQRPLPTERVLRMRELYDRNKVGLLEGIGIDLKFGEAYIEAEKHDIPASGLGKLEWVRQNLPCVYQYANRRKLLVAEYPEFLPAHNWYQQSGFAEGWRTVHDSRVDYAREVIRLHRRHLKGEPPPGPTIPSTRNVSTKALLKQTEEKLKEYERALYNAVIRYRRTREGAGYEDALLDSAKLSEWASMRADADGTSQTIQEDDRVRDTVANQDATDQPAGSTEVAVIPDQPIRRRRKGGGRKPEFIWSDEMREEFAILSSVLPTLGEAAVGEQWGQKFYQMSKREMIWAEKHLGSRRKLRARLIDEGKLTADSRRKDAAES
jgi:hypothetical protein